AQGRKLLPASVLEEEPAEWAVPLLDQPVTAQRRQGQARQDFHVDRVLDPRGRVVAPFRDDVRAPRPDALEAVDDRLVLAPHGPDGNALRCNFPGPEFTPGPEGWVLQGTHRGVQCGSGFRHWIPPLRESDHARRQGTFPSARPAGPPSWR